VSPNWKRKGINSSSSAERKGKKDKKFFFFRLFHNLSSSICSQYEKKISISSDKKGEVRVTPDCLEGKEGRKERR